jgi:Recombination endonuclease VII
MADAVVIYFGPHVSRDDAAREGKRRYFNGRPCSKGHVAEREVMSCTCVECHRLNAKDRRARSPAKPRYRSKEDRRRNRPREIEQQRTSREAKRVKEAGRPKPSICELCGNPGRIVFDHCHASGAFRGWICDPCNQALGLVKDNPELLRKMAAYLERSGGEANGEETQRAA